MPTFILSPLVLLAALLPIRADYRSPRWQLYVCKPLTTVLILLIALGRAPGSPRACVFALASPLPRHKQGMHTHTNTHIRKAHTQHPHLPRLLVSLALHIHSLRVIRAVPAHTQRDGVGPLVQASVVELQGGVVEVHCGTGCGTFGSTVSSVKK